MNDGFPQTSVIICPGVHDAQLTQSFLAELNSDNTNTVSKHWFQNVLIFPTQDYPAYSAIHILEFLQRCTGSMTPPVIFISFSAGVAGAIGAALGWQTLGGKVKAFIAFDGWGVPLYGDFPIHRISHDYFTHWSSALLGAGKENFYADPAVEHLDLWRSPNSSKGWWVHPATNDVPEQRTFTTAAEFVNHLLRRYL
ncbi:MAG: hypothetical protein KME25_01955 [Symplocastrum torsivum CPER-KK1]|jgi:hypothetical protein|uniref:Alpha/beta hydrolase n=1 Tax=Symplocastrum torsivum CPER-KK1 TaxID=450513 RepID=A0A951PH04_9CYAN|nr:hypothetical protein [Symplocastrum torsivum CPER-KK1]